MPTLDFKGKQFVYSHHHTVPFRELAVDAAKSHSPTPSLEDNLIIHGDNLHGLKALLPLYAGKIKCIYIDPPYNTGNEGWCYNDNVNSPLIREWLKKTANPVDKEDMERHDKWLCMMFPRLKLLHELLADDGVIFVSIDDNEVHHLRAVMDEIWGEENFVSEIAVKSNPRGSQASRDLAEVHEYILVYSKRYDECVLSGLPLGIRTIDEYNLEDAQRQKYRLLGLRQRGGAWRKEDRLKMHYPLYVNPVDGNVSLDKTNVHTIEVIPQRPSGELGRWTWSPEKARKDNHLLIGKKINRVEHENAWDIFRIDYLNNSNGNLEKTEKPKTIWDEKELNYQNGRTEINDLLGTSDAFNYPKPSHLIKKSLVIGADKNAIILDSFAGSGTTAHAVLALNKEDGGNRKFILVEMEDYADTITAERVRRVINGVPTAKDNALQQGLGGSFTFCTLGDAFDIEKMLKGEALPTWDALARYVFYTATGKSLKEGTLKANADYFVGETELYEVYLIYKPDLAFLRSPDCALNSTKVEQIALRGGKKQKLVFAADKFMSQKDLTDKNITFCQLPYAIHKVGV